MKVDLDMLGGNKDNYYNFKREIRESKVALNLSLRYIYPFFTDSKLGKLQASVQEIKKKLDEIEFED